MICPNKLECDYENMHFTCVINCTKNPIHNKDFVFRILTHKYVLLSRIDSLKEKQSDVLIFDQNHNLEIAIIVTKLQSSLEPYNCEIKDLKAFIHAYLCDITQTIIDMYV